MLIRSTIIIECDKCKIKFDTGAYDVEFALRFTSMQGWGQKGSRDYCPECSIAISQETEEDIIEWIKVD